MPRTPPNLYRRDGVWYGRVNVAGKEHRRSLRTGDVREAKIEVDQWIKKLEKNAYSSAPPKPNFKEAVIKWVLEILPGSVKPQVARRYKTSIKSIEKVMGNTPVDKIDGVLISTYISSRKNQVSNATLRRDLTALSNLLSACAAWGWVTSGNVAAGFDRKIIKERRELISMVSQEEYQDVLNELPPSMADLLQLLDQTGMRLNEAVTLERWQVDFDKQQILLDKTKTDRPRVISFKTPAGDAEPILKRYKNTKKGALFTNRDGLIYSNFSSNFGQVMRRLIARAEKEKRSFSRFRVHDLRHMFAIRWLSAFGNIYKLQRHLGHTSVKTTEIYLAYVGEKEQEAAKFGSFDVVIESAQKSAHQIKRTADKTTP